MKTKIALALIALFSVSQLSLGKDDSSKKNIEIAVTTEGFVPKAVQVAPGDDVTLVITRKTDSTCAKSVTIPKLKIKEALPLNKSVTLKLGKLEKGKIRFGCGMGMMVGGVVVTE